MTILEGFAVEQASLTCFNCILEKSMKIYTVERMRTGAGAQVVAFVNGRPLQHIVYHSPCGFEFGYAGSGPSDLALSILCDFFGEQPDPEQIRWGTFKAWEYYHEFKLAFITPQKLRMFKITHTQIENWLASRERQSQRTTSKTDCP